MTRRLPLSLILLLALCSSAWAQTSRYVYIEPSFRLTEYTREQALPYMKLGIAQFNYEYGTNHTLVDKYRSGAVRVIARDEGNFIYGKIFRKGDPNSESPGRSYDWVIYNSRYFANDPWTAASVQSLIRHEIGHFAFGPEFEHSYFPPKREGWVNPVPGPVPTPGPTPDPKPTPTPDADAALKARIIAQFRKEGFKKDLPIKEVNKALDLYKSYLPDVKTAEEKVFGKNKKGGYIEKRVDQLTVMSPNSEYRLVAWQLEKRAKQLR